MNWNWCKATEKSADIISLFGITNSCHTVKNQERQIIHWNQIIKETTYFQLVIIWILKLAQWCWYIFFRKKTKTKWAWKMMAIVQILVAVDLNCSFWFVFWYSPVWNRGYQYLSSRHLFHATSNSMSSMNRVIFAPWDHFQSKLTLTERCKTRLKMVRKFGD